MSPIFHFEPYCSQFDTHSVHYNESECLYPSPNTILTPRKTLNPHKLPAHECFTSRIELLQPIETLNLHEFGTIQFKGDIEEIKSSIQTTSHCTPAFLVPNEQFPFIIDPDKCDYSTGLKLQPPPLATFNNVDTLLQFAQKWAQSHGYALTKKDSHQGKNFYLECDQYGEYIHLKGPTQRKSTTKKCRCKSRLRGSIPAPSN
ncbi:hypothetical protein O181_067765 [Austropuccinia psidii MF-1]|uniref:Uncharacterized protein n=1 Tax=Austropuccinia psidii MF-1 TaxID=1389203 RepID=A0A9Q3EZN9_9BASI|nr:hypothetical protein [Austropuccinia psidii MF-1]